MDIYDPALFGCSAGLRDLLHLDDPGRAIHRGPDIRLVFLIAHQDLVDAFFCFSLDQVTAAIPLGDAPSLGGGFHAPIAADALLPMVDDAHHQAGMIL